MIFFYYFFGDISAFVSFGLLFNTLVSLKNWAIFRRFTSVCLDLEKACSSVILYVVYMCILVVLNAGHSQSMWWAVSSGVLFSSMGSCVEQ